MLQSNETRKQAGIVTPISDKIYFKLKLVRTDEENIPFILIKDTVGQKDNTTLNIYVPNPDTPNFMKKCTNGFKETD